MKTALSEERLFPHGLDPVDGILCVAADARPAEVAAHIHPHHWRFALQLDAQAPLREQVAASPFANASARFGPWCDNITGMNWRKPDGQVLRLGEQVVKSTTGYDLMRFLLGSGPQYGQAIDYVLRLRPLCDTESRIYLDGESGVLSDVVPSLLRSTFLPWLDAVDWLESPTTEASRIRLTVHALGEELPVFHDFANDLARAHGLSASLRTDDPQGLSDGLPDLVFKTTPDRAVAMARHIRQTHNLRCCALCASGVVHCFLPEADRSPEKVATLAAPYAPDLEAIGGDWHSRHHSQLKPQPDEAAWIECLITALG